MPRPDIIPEQLMEKCAAMSVRVNAIKELTDSMASQCPRLHEICLLPKSGVLFALHNFKQIRWCKVWF